MTDSFEQLEVYQAAREFRQRIYKLVEQLPKDEKFVLVPQMRRAALSVTNNIAEGAGSDNWKNNISYLYRSRGSMNELLDDLNLCEDQAYFKPAHLDDLRKDAERVNQLINGYIRDLETQLSEYMANKKPQRPKRKTAS